MSLLITVAEAMKLALEQLHNLRGFEHAEITLLPNAHPGIRAFLVKGAIGYWVSVDDRQILLHQSSNQGVKTFMLTSSAKEEISQLPD